MCHHEYIQAVHLGVDVAELALCLVIACIRCHVKWPIAVGAILIAWLR